MAVPRSNGASPPGDISYAYMFEADKSPTMQFDALLRAMARFIVTELGDRNDAHLNPKKLAAFYKAVGGDYDSLFLETPHSAISYIWQVTGCQHSLQPTDNDFAPPSIPTLTPRGFSRWESIEVLLEPEMHVPFIQHAVKHWSLRHPETGQAFPPDLPASVFPSEPDPQVDRWHKQCAEKMRDEANKEEEGASMPTSGSAPRPPPFAEPAAAPRFAYVHTADPFRSTSPRSRAADPNQYERFTYVRVGESHGANFGQRPSMRSPERSRRQRPVDDSARRRSFSDYASTRQPHRDGIRHSYSGTYLNPESNRTTPSRPSQNRRHSHFQRYSSDSSGDESVDESAHTRARRRHRTGSPTTPGVRRVVPPSSSGPPPPSAGSSVPSFRTHRSDSRAEEARRRGSPFGGFREKLSETVSNIIPGSRNSSRGHSSANDPIRVRRSREHIPPSRLNQNHSDLASDGLSEGSSEEERRRRHRLREERDRYRADDADSGGRRERQQHPRRPESQRRTSSHADAERRQAPGWDVRDRDRLREERKKWDRRSVEDDLGGSGAMPSRRYQESAYT